MNWREPSCHVQTHTVWVRLVPYSTDTYAHLPTHLENPPELAWCFQQYQGAQLHDGDVSLLLQTFILQLR
jgi:hypothetical protein